MKEIPLTKGKVALVDDADHEWLARWSWSARLIKPTGLWYAARTTGLADYRANPSLPTVILMHREILRAPDGVLVDHRNGEPLDNQRQNLRLCDYTQNLGNQRKRTIRGGSRYKGVTKVGKRFVANCAGRRIGTFKDEINAAMAYDAFARDRWGEFAALNFPNPGEQSALADHPPVGGAAVALSVAG